MTTAANQAVDARANVLRGQTIPNTRRPDLPDPDAEAGELWRGPGEARWVARPLRGASPPHDRTSTPVGCVAHG